MFHPKILCTSQCTEHTSRLMAVVSFRSYKSYRLNQNSSSDNNGGDLREKHSNNFFDILENKIVPMVICTFQLNLVIVELNYISSNLFIYNMVSFVIHRSFIVPYSFV